MLNFRTAYLQAMRDQSPTMFRELRRTGAMEAHLDRKAEEARAMFAQLTEGLPRLPSGALANPQDEQRATELVMQTLIAFPPPAETPDQPEPQPMP